MTDQKRLQEIEASIGMGVYTTPLGYKNTRFRLEDAAWLLSKVRELKKEEQTGKSESKRYRQAIEGAVAHFRQDEHPEGMALLEQALRGGIGMKSPEQRAMDRVTSGLDLSDEAKEVVKRTYGYSKALAAERLKGIRQEICRHQKRKSE